MALLAEVTATAPPRSSEGSAGPLGALKVLAASAWLLGMGALTRTKAPPLDWSLDLPGVLLAAAAVLSWMVSTRARIALSVEGGLRRFFASTAWNASFVTVLAVAAWEVLSLL